MSRETRDHGTSSDFKEGRSVGNKQCPVALYRYLAFRLHSWPLQNAPSAPFLSHCESAQSDDPAEITFASTSHHVSPSTVCCQESCSHKILFIGLVLLFIITTGYDLMSISIKEEGGENQQHISLAVL
ncbi:hypothetical protein MATL_G00173360 [Megalops atlanticus]|uniref:Uncharacterized protein n=1 Tax=Megalops atlanticus TaxID=7932 RepID=A0A9D3PTG0_MEGAT|nr:hypothetical protein MATL_G00173360 [Megalops atlanticus]